MSGRFPVPDETERKDKNRPPRNHRLYLTTTKDFETWEDVSTELVMPKGIRHGTALRVPRAVVNLIK